ncbi:hypothetical protein WR25_06394 [Diploscapter pachys]|uniref:Neurotransmitter-gated ion-channel ligand-binding domain-containing protein n=1 Tax=Diploscapter pachys TaxID=2018661 RepID=A0A2A2LL40_9BILA|nr:hypothetical protein WR25_17123 [Diploscapter pachys]PAV91409.1 hypothetical protein WR25_06394 [Diploscapter pachys]
MNVDENEMETNAIISDDGRVVLFRALITDISCNLSLEQFPFDQQVCYLTFASWSMDGSKLYLSATPDTDNLELYIRNTEWTLTDFKVKPYIKVYDCCPYPFPDVSFFMVLRRSPSYYIFSLVIPSAFITVVTIVGFFTPHSTTVMMVSDEVPATSEVIPLIGKYYIGLIFLIFLAAFTTTITLSYQMRGNAGTEVDPRVKDFFFHTIAGNPYIAWAFSFQLPHNLRKSSYVCRKRTGVQEQIKASLDDMRDSIQKERDMKRIQFEWQQITRILDRMIMFTYIIITVIFAFYMLASREPEIRLDDEIMDRVKRA